MGDPTYMETKCSITDESLHHKTSMETPEGQLFPYLTVGPASDETFSGAGSHLAALYMGRAQQALEQSARGRHVSGDG